MSALSLYLLLQCSKTELWSLLYANFRWPVAYFGSETATAHQIYNIFWKYLDILSEHGFVIDYVMFDGASANRSFTNMLFAVSPREEKFIFRDIFFREHQMCVIQDNNACA